MSLSRRICGELVLSNEGIFSETMLIVLFFVLCATTIPGQLNLKIQLSSVGKHNGISRLESASRNKWRNCF